MKLILNCTRHHYLTRVGIFLILAALIAAIPGCGYYGPRPTLPDYWEIRDWYDLHAIYGDRDGMRASHILMNDLDSTTAGYAELAGPVANEGKGWRPMGALGVLGGGFAGSLDGRGHEIRDLFINRPDEDAVGLFRSLGSGGVIMNVRLVNADVTGYTRVGGLVGYKLGTIDNCHFSGSVAGTGNVGGLVGYNAGPVNNSYSAGSVTGGWAVGGVAGRIRSTINNCHFTGSVTGDWKVGGLVGHSDSLGTVMDSYALGNVSGGGQAGGLVGLNEGTVHNSCSSTSVTGEHEVGGLVGGNTGTVGNCYATGSVSGSERVGGLVGFVSGGAVSNSYATASVTGDDRAGGLTGGLAEASRDNVTNSFWDTETSGMPRSHGGIGKSTAELMDIATFRAAGWSIIAVAPGEKDPAYTWNIVDGQTYPFLSRQSVS